MRALRIDFPKLVSIRIGDGSFSNVKTVVMSRRERMGD